MMLETKKLNDMIESAIEAVEKNISVTWVEVLNNPENYDPIVVETIDQLHYIRKLIIKKIYIEKYIEMKNSKVVDIKKYASVKEMNDDIRKFNI